MRLNLIISKTIIVLLLLIFSSVFMPASISFSNVTNNNSIYSVEIEGIRLNEINENFSLLIISPEEFKKQLTPLVQHKNEMGMKTELVTLNQIYQEENNGSDDAENIKFFIKSAIENYSIEYVLLVGGKKSYFSIKEDWWIPVRYVKVNIVTGDYNDTENFISDLYYADIYHFNLETEQKEFCSWDSNGDKKYGQYSKNESENDLVDLEPDISIGRLPCRNRFEVKIMVEKIINYEKEKCEDSWFKRILVVAGDAVPDMNGNYYEGEVESQKILEYMDDFDHTRLWVSRGTLKGPRDVIREINKGCGFLYMAGEATPSIWKTYPPENNQTVVFGLSTFHVPFLRNRQKLPVCIMSGCHINMFNVSFFNRYKTCGIPTFECLSWRIVRKIGGGGIATIGSTGVAYNNFFKDNSSKGGGVGYLHLNFFDDYANNNTDILGNTWNNAIKQYLRNCPIPWVESYERDSGIDRKTIQLWTLTGDPSLKIGGYPTN